jgi:hypothetical protein
MTGAGRFIAAAACWLPGLCFSQAAACGQFLGSWSGGWSQGFYGTQWIHVTEVSPDCMARVAYSPSGEAPASTLAVPIRDGAMLIAACNTGTGGSCRLEVHGDELRAIYSDPSGFVNTGTFRRNR